MKSNDSNPCKIVIVMRHAERSDMSYDGKSKFNIQDPEITDKGYKQAYCIGQQLSQILERLSFPDKGENLKLVCVSSPFARTLQTAKTVLSGLNSSHIKIICENGLSEFISKETFESSPSSFLEILQQNPLLLEELSDLEVETFSPQSELPNYPESFNSCVERYRETHRKLIKKCLIEQDYNIILMVTHGYGVQIISEMMNISEEVYEYDFCNTQIFSYNSSCNEFKYIQQINPIIKNN